MAVGQQIQIINKCFDKSNFWGIGFRAVVATATSRHRRGVDAATMSRRLTQISRYFYPAACPCYVLSIYAMHRGLCTDPMTRQAALTTITIVTVLIIIVSTRTALLLLYLKYWSQADHVK